MPASTDDPLAGAADNPGVEHVETTSAREMLGRLDGSWCGYDLGGWPDSTWILHAMYERDDVPSGLSHDDVYRIERALEPPPTGIHAILDAATLLGNPGGRSGHPGPPWRRLRWRELARRRGVHPFARGWPSSSSFGTGSWPVNIRPPAEGTLDREQYVRLLEVLAAHSADGDHTDCFVLHAACWDFVHEHLYTGTLRQASRHYDEALHRGGPNNVWSADRAWFVYTDYDLQGTRVSGDPRLIAALRADRYLETVDLPNPR